MSEVAAVLHRTCVEHMDTQNKRFMVSESYNKRISANAQHTVYLKHIQNTKIPYINWRENKKQTELWFFLDWTFWFMFHLLTLSM